MPYLHGDDDDDAEVVGSNGGVTFRVYGEKAAALMGVAPETAADADEIAKRKAKPKSKGRGAP